MVFSNIYSIYIYVCKYILYIIKMKNHKIFTIDEEICKKLEGINASELVNRLLIEYFNRENNINLEDLKQKMAENKRLSAEIRKKGRILRQNIAKIEEKEYKAKILGTENFKERMLKFKRSQYESYKRGERGNNQN